MFGRRAPILPRGGVSIAGMSRNVHATARSALALKDLLATKGRARMEKRVDPANREFLEELALHLGLGPEAAREMQFTGRFTGPGGYVARLRRREDQRWCVLPEIGLELRRDTTTSRSPEDWFSAQAGLLRDFGWVLGVDEGGQLRIAFSRWLAEPVDVALVLDVGFVIAAALSDVLRTH